MSDLTDDERKQIEEAFEAAKVASEAKGVYLRMVDIKGTIYFYPELPAE